MRRRDAQARGAGEMRGRDAQAQGPGPSPRPGVSRPRLALGTHLPTCASGRPRRLRRGVVRFAGALRWERQRASPARIAYALRQRVSPARFASALRLRVSPAPAGDVWGALASDLGAGLVLLMRGCPRARPRQGCFACGSHRLRRLRPGPGLRARAGGLRQDGGAGPSCSVGPGGLHDDARTNGFGSNGAGGSGGGGRTEGWGRLRVSAAASSGVALGGVERCRGARVSARGAAGESPALGVGVGPGVGGVHGAGGADHRCGQEKLEFHQSRPLQSLDAGLQCER